MQGKKDLIRPSPFRPKIPIGKSVSKRNNCNAILIKDLNFPENM